MLCKLRTPITPHLVIGLIFTLSRVSAPCQDSTVPQSASQNLGVQVQQAAQKVLTNCASWPMRRVLLVIWMMFLAAGGVAQNPPTLNPLTAPYDIVSGKAQTPTAPYTAVRIAVCMAPAAAPVVDCTAGEMVANSVPLSRNDNAVAGGYQYIRVNADGTFAAITAAPLTQGDNLWVVEFADQAAGLTHVVISPAMVVNPPAAPVPVGYAFYPLTPVLLVGGINVAAASSADPSAKFLLNATLEHAITRQDRDENAADTPAHRSSYLNAPLWTSGYIRLASMAQPGSVSGLSNLPTYVSPLLTKTADQIVQSAEAEVGLEANIFASDKGRHINALLTKADTSTPVTTVHFIAEGGVITPLSPNQANPTVYVVSPALYAYYKSNVSATGLLGTASTEVTNACNGTTVAGTSNGGNCYIAYLPQDRTRFYRQWDAGFRLRWYYHSSDTDQHFLFPDSVTATFGQNEYVTRGQLRNFVLHLAGAASLPPNLGGSLAGLLYAYGTLDLNVNGQNQNGQEFLLNAADASVTTSSPNVANVTVQTPYRDRYQFGVALDLAKLVSLMKNSGGAAQ